MRLMKLSSQLKKVSVILVAALLSAATVFGCLYTSAGFQRNRRLIDKSTAQDTFSKVATIFSDSFTSKDIVTREPYWKYQKAATGPYPITPFDYINQWVITNGEVSTTVENIPFSVERLVAFDSQLKLAGFSTTPVDRGYQKAAIQKTLNGEVDQNGYWHTYYGQIQYARDHPTKSFEDVLKQEIAIAQSKNESIYTTTIKYYNAPLYELSVTYSAALPLPSTGKVTLSLIYGCKDQIDCYTPQGPSTSRW